MSGVIFPTPLDLSLHAKQELVKGIEVSQDTTAKIQQLMPNILAEQKNHPEIKWYNGSNLVFSVASIPHLIFKMPSSANENRKNRFENMIKAKQVCLNHNLNLLVIPHAKKFEVDFRGKKKALIAEERINIQPEEHVQESLYRELSGLDKTIQQLAIFIAKTGFSDVTWRNIPIIDDAPDFWGPRRIALVDLEEMNDASIGIFGATIWRRGLINCIYSEKQVDSVMNEARLSNIVRSFDTVGSLERLRADRIADIAFDRMIRPHTSMHLKKEPSFKPIRHKHVHNFKPRPTFLRNLRIPLKSMM